MTDKRKKLLLRRRRAKERAMGITKGTSNSGGRRTKRSQSVDRIGVEEGEDEEGEDEEGDDEEMRSDKAEGLDGEDEWDCDEETLSNGKCK